MILLHDYWRSSAAYRVRIALDWKRLAYARVRHDLTAGEQRRPDFLARNPQGLVPVIDCDGMLLSQSPAILEWLEERYPEPALLPEGIMDRAIVRSMMALVCCDVHPLANLRVRQALADRFGADEGAITAWCAGWIEEGLAALEELLRRHGGLYAFGDRVTFADCCLVPQVFAAQRFSVDPGRFPAIQAVTDRCLALAAFQPLPPE